MNMLIDMKKCSIFGSRTDPVSLLIFLFLLFFWGNALQ